MGTTRVRKEKVAGMKKRAAEEEKKGRKMHSHRQVKAGPHDYEQKILEKEEKIILRCLRHGGSINDAAKLVNVSPRLLRKKKAKYPEFGDAVERARVIGKMHHLKRIFNGVKEWRSSAWLLERMFFQEFGARQPDSYTKEQVLFLLMRLTQIINEVVKDAKSRSAINTQVQILLENLNTEKKEDESFVD